MFDLVGLLREWYRSNHQDKKEAHAKTVEQLTKHTEDLKPILRKLETDPLASSDERLFNATKKHIETGYPALWSLLEGNTGLRATSNKHSALEKQYLVQIKNVIKEKLPQDIPLSDDFVDLFVPNIKTSIEAKIVNNKTRKFQVLNTINRPELIKFQLAYESGDSSQIVYCTGNLPEIEQKDLADILNSIINDNAELQNQFNIIRDLKAQIGIK